MFRPIYSKQVYNIWTISGFTSVVLLAALLKLEITVSFFWLSLSVHSGSLKRIKFSKLYSLAHTLLLNVFFALKGTRLYILLANLCRLVDWIESNLISYEAAYIRPVSTCTCL